MKNGLLLCALALPLVCAAASPAKAAEKLAAEVNGAPVYRSAVERRMWELYGGKTLSDMIDEALLAQQAKKLGITADRELVERNYAVLRGTGEAEKSFLSAMKLAGVSETEMRQRVEQRLLAIAVVARMRGLSPSDKEAEDYFNQNRASFDKPEGLMVTQLTVSSAGEAQDMLAALKAGAYFKNLAAAKCSVNRLCNAEGTPVPLYRGQLPPEKEKELFSVAPGQHTGVIDNNGYYHVLRVVAQLPAVKAEFSQYKDTIRETLFQSRVDQAAATVVKELRAAAKIKTFSR